MSYPYLYPGECPTLDDIREAMAEQRPMGADTRSGLVGWWPGRHRGSILRDFSGRANTGAWSGTGTRWAADATRQGIVTTFNGTDDSILTTQAALLSGAEAVTYSMWVWPDGVQSAYAGLLVARGSGVINGIDYYNTTNIGIFVNNTVGVVTTIPTSQTWTHVAATWDNASDTARFYFDGRLVASPAISAGAVNQTTAFRIGLDTSGSQYFTGRLDDLRIYTRALTPAEIRHIYNCGLVAPLSDLVEPLGWETVGAGGVVVPWHLFGRVA